MRLIYRLISRLPRNSQHFLRRYHFRRLARTGNLIPDEPEIADVTTHTREGDWVIDVGANVGRYACYMARLVGPRGRVLAFEPVLATFCVLAENVRQSGASNVTLFNIALSSRDLVLNMSVPVDPDTGLSNYYQARISESGAPVFCLKLDSFSIPHAVRLIKIDAEGHDLEVLEGAEQTIQRDRPVVIVEGWESGAAAAWLRERGYSIHKRAGSPNLVALPGAQDMPASTHVG